MSAKTSLILQSALMATGLVQPVSEKVKGGYLEVLNRQVPGQEKGWLQAVDKLLVLSETLPAAELHICRRYVRKNGQMVFGWHISIDCKSAKALQEVVGEVARVLGEFRPTLEEPPPRPEPAVVAQPAHRQPLAPGRHPSPQMPPPRPPNEPGTVIGSEPPNFRPAVRVVQNTRDGEGKVHIVEEMPLPHVYSEMNRPNSKGKGAKLTGGG